MFFNLLAERARNDIMDALRVRSMGQPAGGFAVKPQLPQAAMPVNGMPQAQMPPQAPQAQSTATGAPFPPPAQMPAMSGLGAPYGMQSAMPMAPRPMSAQGAMRFAHGGHVWRVR